ncbi:hypothetical protein Bca52824_013090 [Brassica carinata]|uniref:valine--tRNA ligase n=1 Tax=Brassica carinata TaxID=52824 RepID=A0A8X7VYX1_BRACI|nr:hypothetical protein Bca52824_013090 [Brassica carinata]
MSGFHVLWVPGMDHAGIATQTKVEKQLKDRGLTRHDLGREEFIRKCGSEKDLTQLRRLGASLDWSRECFTMDEQRSKAVTEAFVRFYNEGLIYRDIRLVHWDCHLKTAVSDAEVEHIDIKEKTLLKVPGYEKPVEFGLITIICLPSGGRLGRDSLIFMGSLLSTHLMDASYQSYAMENLLLQSLVLVVSRLLLLMTPNDFELGKRHNLEFINIFTDDGKINTNGGSDFTGMPRFAAREAIVEALKNQGLYRGAQNKEMRLGLCQRTCDVIEPMVKPQWYVNCSMIAKDALDSAATSDGNKKLEFIPKQFTAERRRWLENIRDWCISRQLWWGHRIPAWYATLEEDQLREIGAYNDHWVVARTEEEARREAAEKFSGKKFDLTQDDDVLDTWFSSGIFPLSALGWPDETDDFKDMIFCFFWVARMVMMGMKLSGDVYLHPMIRDAHGRKMSKSLGNVIDPIEVIDGATLEALHKRLEEVKDFPNGISECGADALPFALVSYTAQSDKINLDILRVVGYRQWCNKLWNAVRFALIRLGDGYSPPLALRPETMPFSCKWILSVLNKSISKTVESLNAFEFSDAANTVYAWWHPALASERAHAQHALWVSLETGLRLLHPCMPFVTEELWQRLPSPKNYERKASIVICGDRNGTVLASVKCLRALRAELLEKQKNERLPAFALCENNVTYEIVKSHELEIRTLANLSSLEVVLKGEHAAPAGSAVETENENLKVYLKVDRAINLEAEQEKIRNKIAELQKQKEKLQKIMSASGYEEKAPAKIKEDNVTTLAKILQEFDFFEKESARLVAETGSI